MIKWAKRGLWFTLFFMAVCVVIVSKWAGYHLLLTPCEQALHCENPFRLTEEGAVDLARYGLTVPFYASMLVVFSAIAAFSYLAMGVLLFRYRGDRLYGFSASLFLIIVGTIFSTDEQALLQYPVILTFFHLLDSIGSFYLPFLFLFPDGRFKPRWAIVPAAVWIGVQGYRYVAPPSWEQLTWDPVFMTVLLLVTHGPLLFSLVYRYRAVSSDSMQRRHIRWFLYSVLSYLLGGAMFAVSFLLQNGLLQLIFQVSFFAGLLFWPFSIGIAVFEHGSPVPGAASLQRTVLFYMMSFLIFLFYGSAVGGLSVLFREQDVMVALIAGGLLAISFQPIYARLKRSMNRLIYGEPQTPYQILSRLVERMDQVVQRHAVWSEVVQGIAQALHLPYAALYKQRENERELIAEYGTCTNRQSEMPLKVGEEVIGALVLGAHDAKKRMDAEESRLLDQLISLVSGALQSVRMTEELGQSRERLVLAREEERRRLGRDLHDGLGASLAGTLLKTDAIADRYAGDPQLAKLLSEIQEGIEEGIADVRRLAYSLRPPILDELGLLHALQELAMRYAPVDIQLDAPEHLPPLGAALEVAVYRIAQEALTNALRHGAATRFGITLQFTDKLELTLTDNGSGITDDDVPGVGTRSMRERAEELGGRCRIESLATGGAAVRVELPLPKEGGLI